MPELRTVMRWLGEDREGFRQQYTKAKEDQADTLAEDILHIADNTQEGVKTKTLANGQVETQAGDMTEHRKLQIDARKWIAARLKPKKYGDKVENTLKGDAENPIQINATAAKW